MVNHYYSVIDLNLGPVGLVWREEGWPRLIRVILPEDRLSIAGLVEESFPGASPKTHSAIDEIGRTLGEDDAGKEAKSAVSALELQHWSKFYQCVWMACAGIPRGKVSTYGRLATAIGSHRAARAVGTALGKNPFPLIIPCHRIVQADGGLGGFSAGGPAVKRRLLEREGIDFDGRGRVKLADHADQ